MVIWDREPLQSQNHDAVGADIDLVLWGKARQFGDGIVVKAFLTIPPKSRQAINDKWQIALPHDGTSITVETDLPNRRYEFAPVVLDPAIVKRFTTPDALPLYSALIGGKIKGNLGSAYEGIEQSGDAIRVDTYDTNFNKREAHCWIYLPV